MDRKDRRRTDQQADITIGSLTDVGRARKSNQDAYCALLAPNAPLDADTLIAVADGMGGHKGGDVASTMAIQRLISRLSANDERGRPTLEGYRDHLAAAYEDANDAVIKAAANPDLSGMGTTLTAALVAGNQAILAQVGDSRAYLLRNGKIQQVTHDHSWVAEQVAAGKLSAAEASRHPKRNMLTRAIGIARTVAVDTTAVELLDGDRLLLCSDGLHGLVSDKEIQQISTTASPQEACVNLVALANERGGPDNSTVVIAAVNRVGVAVPSSATRARHQQTTMGVRGGRRRRLSPWLLLLSPIWGPFWLARRAFSSNRSGESR